MESHVSQLNSLKWLTASLLLGLLFVLLAGAGCEKAKHESVSENKAITGGKAAVEKEEAKLRFSDMTAASGVQAVYDNGESSNQYSIAESLGGGVASFDFDLDGKRDLFFPGGGKIEQDMPLTGKSGSLWRAADKWKYSEVTKASGLAYAPCYSHGALSADYNHDGFDDLLVTGYGGIVLFENCGDGTFRDVTALAGLGPIQWSSSAAWGDFDANGTLDLYVAQYVNWSWKNNPACAGGSPDKRDVCTPQYFEGLNDKLFWNEGEGTFTSADADAGLVPGGKGLGVITFDANNDSKLDIYVANDTTNNFLYLNQGNRKFKESGVISGTAFDNMGIPNGSMGIAIFDQDGDRKSDLFVTNYERETFAVYRNDGNANFRHISERTGITALGKLLVGFGTTSGDFALSGWEDLIVANGHVMRYPVNMNRKQEPLYIKNGRDGRMTRQAFESGTFFGSRYCSRGVIADDLDEDGKLDLVFSNVNEPANLLKNDSEVTGTWVKLQLTGTTSNRNAIGAKVILKTSQGEMVRQVIGGGSYLSQGPYLLHWGIPKDSTPTAFEITWPSGERSDLKIDKADMTYYVVE